MPAGAPFGNQNAKKSRLFEQAFIRALKQRDLSAEDGETLRKIADKMIDLALGGDVAAFREARDTVDGKPKQMIEGPGDAGEHTVIQRIEEKIVDPAA